MRKRRLQLLMCSGLICLLLAGCDFFGTSSTVSISTEPSSGHTPLLVQLSAQSDASWMTYEWRLADQVLGYGPSISHEFTGKGDVLVQLICTDQSGHVIYADTVITLRNRLPHAEFTIQPSQPSILLPIWFDGRNSYDPDGEIVSYHWDFGDETTASGAVVTHTYLTPHVEYRVVLTVADDSGDSNQTYRTLKPSGCDH